MALRAALLVLALSAAGCAVAPTVSAPVRASTPGGRALPGQRSAAFVTAGVIRATQKVAHVDSFGSFDADESGLSPAFGIGTNSCLGEMQMTCVHLSLFRFFDMRDYSATDHDNDLLSVGFLLHQ